MIFTPKILPHEPFLKAWIHKQVELLSRQLLHAGIDIRPTALDFQAIYVIEHNDETVHCSPEQAYATLQFFQALHEREQRDDRAAQDEPRATTQIGASIDR
ncbi:MAG: hypothetical protein AAFZ49_00540 [Cyanobacteria bacterium J06659_2]